MDGYNLYIAFTIKLTMPLHYSYKATAIFCWLLCTLGLNADAQLKLSGQLLYEEDQKVAKHMQLQLISMTIGSDTLYTLSDDKGHFNFNAAAGQYLLLVQDKQLIWHQQDIDLNKDTILDPVRLDHSLSSELEGFNVIAHKSSLQMREGRLIYTPPMLSAQSAFEVLQTTPTLAVGPESIEILGKGTPRIMMNGRWERMELSQLIIYLKSIPAAEVKRIEIIRNPGAELDAEATSGYINIVLKSRKVYGLNGSLAGSAAKAAFFHSDVMGSINASLGRLQLNANASLGGGRSKTNGNNNLHYDDKYWQEHNLQERPYRSRTLSMGADYQLSDRHSIGASGNLQLSDWTGEEYNTTQIFNLSRTRIDSSLLTEGLNPELLNNYSANINYTFNMDSSGRKLRFDLDHFVQSFGREQDFSNSQFDAAGRPLSTMRRFLSGNDQQMLITTADLQMDLPTRWAKISYGTKYTYISNRNKTSFYERINDSWTGDPARFDHFVYDETTYALFAKAGRTVNRWDINAGLRFEHTRTLGTSEVYNVRNKNEYSKLFPSLDVTYNRNERYTYSLNYSRRIDRPMFAQVNPFRWYHTQYAFTNGNPSLQPYFSHNIELGHIIRQQYFLNAYYTRSDNMFSELDVIDTGNNMRETRVENILNMNTWGMAASAQVNVWKRWLLMPQLGISYTQIFSKSDILDNSAGIFIYASIYQQVSLDKDRQWLLDLSSYYYAPRSYGIMQFKSIWAQSVTLTFSTRDKKWQFVLAANDIFRTAAMRYNSIINETLRERFVYRDQQRVGITARYNFEYGRTEARKQKRTANQDEMNRVGG